MKTKEAIENVNGVYAQVAGAFCCSTKESNKFEKEKKQVINLLKRGEKFEKMYNKIKFIAGFNISVDEERDQVRTMLEEYVKNMKVKKILIRTDGK